jgi:hypothetical protein
VLVTAGNVNEGTQLIRLVDEVEPVAEPDGSTRRYPDKLHAGCPLGDGV